VKRMRTFIVTCVSLTLAMPYARFYTRSLYWDLSTVQQPTGSKAKLLEGCVASGGPPKGKDFAACCSWRGSMQAEPSGDTRHSQLACVNEH
jgi:hypothetical protein